MKNIKWAILFLLISWQLNGQDVYTERQERTEWFQDARFGMFLHWGIYAIPARGEWVRTVEQMSKTEYHKYFEQFNPVDYNPKAWAKVAKAAGMKYAVLTAKHHDGFCLFDSKYTAFKATNTPAGRDLVREFLDAFREEGIKVGLYYSLIDWNHPDYPHYQHKHHPDRNREEEKGKPRDFSRYQKYLHNQVKELVTAYGKLDIMWFDFSYEDMKGPKWKATELVQMVREAQPHIIIDNRLGGHMEKKNPEPYAGDFEGPEQIIPYDGVKDEFGRRLPWESCVTLNNNWGYAALDTEYKTSGDVIRILVNCVSKGGNLLLNVGPDARGHLPKQAVDLLYEVGAWMDLNGESIFGCGPADFDKPDWGRYTQRGDTLYAHILDANVGQYYLRGLKGKIQSATMVADGSEVYVTPFWMGTKAFVDGQKDIFMNFGKPDQFTFLVPDRRDTVVRLLLKD